jgi:hypothetical protein
MMRSRASGRGMLVDMARAADGPPPPPEPPSLQDAIGGLLRLPWGVLDLPHAEANLRRALEAPARIERLAIALERAATLLEVLVTEVDPERIRETMARLDRLAASAEKAAEMIDRLDRLLAVAEEMNRTIRQIEGLLEGVRGVVGAPLQNLPLPSVLRRVLRDPAVAAEED